MSDQVQQTEQRTCGFPGCNRPAAAGEAGTGRPPQYCDDLGHNRAAAWRERQRIKGAGLEGRGGIDALRPVAAATQSAAEIGAQVRDILELAMQDLLPRFVEQMSTAGDPDAAAAQIESVTTEAEREEADAAAIESTETVAGWEEELANLSAQAEGYQNGASALQEELTATQEAAAAIALESEAAFAGLRNELTSLQTWLEERITVLEDERNHLAEELDATQASRAAADERARGAVERATAEATRADRAEKAAATARQQVDTARAQLDELREQIGGLRAAEATARAERDAARSEVERERSHGEQRLTDLRASFQEQLDELRAERTGLQTQVDQLRAAAASNKPKTPRKTPSE